MITMAKLSIVVKNNKETKTVKVEGLSEQETVKLIKETLGIGFSFPAMKVHPNTDPIIAPCSAPSPIKTAATDSEGISPVVQAQAYKNRNRQLPLIGSENRSSFSIEDSLRTSLENTKLSPDGVRLFRTYAKCPNCETVHPGRYVNSDQKYLKCFECDDKIEIQPATKDTQIFEGKEIPKLSVDGYYFSAKWQYIEPTLV